eukprot:Gb_34374 [translate_table: standard]
MVATGGGAEERKKSMSICPNEEIEGLVSGAGHAVDSHLDRAPRNRFSDPTASLSMTGKAAFPTNPFEPGTTEWALAPCLRCNQCANLVRPTWGSSWIGGGRLVDERQGTRLGDVPLVLLATGPHPGGFFLARPASPLFNKEINKPHPHELCSGACHNTSPTLDEHLEPTLGPVLRMAMHVPEVIPFPNVERGRHTSSLLANVPNLPLLCEHYGSFQSDSTLPCSPVDLQEKLVGCCTGGGYTWFVTKEVLRPEDRGRPGPPFKTRGKFVGECLLSPFRKNEMRSPLLFNMRSRDRYLTLACDRQLSNSGLAPTYPFVGVEFSLPLVWASAFSRLCQLTSHPLDQIGATAVSVLPSQSATSFHKSPSVVRLGGQRASECKGLKLLLRGIAPSPNARVQTVGNHSMGVWRGLVLEMAVATQGVNDRMCYNLGIIRLLFPSIGIRGCYTASGKGIENGWANQENAIPIWVERLGTTMDDSKWMSAMLDLLSKMHCDLLAPKPHYDIPKVGP